MPSAGAIIGRLFQLPSYYAAGLALVACCPGGPSLSLSRSLSMLKTKCAYYSSLSTLSFPFLYLMIGKNNQLMVSSSLTQLVVCLGMATHNDDSENRTT